MIVPMRDTSREGRKSGDDVGGIGIHDPLDLVLQHQLAALQSRDFELVAGRFGRERADPIVQIAMFGPERVQDSAGGIVVAHPGRGFSPCRCDPKQP